MDGASINESEVRQQDSSMVRDTGLLYLHSATSSYDCTNKDGNQSRPYVVPSDYYTICPRNIISIQLFPEKNEQVSSGEITTRK